MKTSKELATAIEKTITELRTVLKAVPFIHKYDFFDKEKFDNGGFDNLFTKTCHKYGVNEENIRMIAGFKKGEKITLNSNED